jgi:hypothetical protein
MSPPLLTMCSQRDVALASHHMVIGGDGKAGHPTITISVPPTPPDDCYFLNHVRMSLLGCSVADTAQVNHLR